MNFLFGKDIKEFKNCIKSFFKEYFKVFNVLNIFIVVRDKKDIVFDVNGNFYFLYFYFEDGEKVYEFIC